MASNMIVLIYIKCDSKKCPVLEKVMAFKENEHIRAKVVTKNCSNKYNKTMI